MKAVAWTAPRPAVSDFRALHPHVITPTARRMCPGSGRFLRQTPTCWRSCVRNRSCRNAEHQAARRLPAAAFARGCRTKGLAWVRVPQMIVRQPRMGRRARIMGSSEFVSHRMHGEGVYATASAHTSSHASPFRDWCFVLSGSEVDMGRHCCVCRSRGAMLRDVPRSHRR